MVIGKTMGVAICMATESPPRVEILAKMEMSTIPALMAQAAKGEANRRYYRSKRNAINGLKAKISFSLLGLSS